MQSDKTTVVQNVTTKKTTIDTEEQDTVIFYFILVLAASQHAFIHTWRILLDALSFASPRGTMLSPSLETHPCIASAALLFHLDCQIL